MAASRLKSNSAGVPKQARHLRRFLAALLFVFAVFCMATDIVHTIDIVHEILTDDQTIANTTDDADARSLQKMHRFSIRHDTKTFQSAPVVNLNSPLPIVQLTQEQIALLGPLLTIAYFVLGGRFARHIYIEEMLDFFIALIGHIFGKQVQSFTASPSTPAALLTTVNRARPWLDWTLGFVLLLDITLSAILSRELRLHIVEPDYVRKLMALHMAAIAIGVVYFGFDSLHAGLSPWWPAHSNVRRQIVIGGVLAGIGALVLPVGTGLAQLARYGRIQNPRYRSHKLSSRQIVKLPHGFYRNPRSGTIHFVDRAGRISTHDRLKALRLIHLSQITERDFPQLAPLAAKTCFEKQALSALGGNNLLDAVDWLELGVKYEVFRFTKDPQHRVNARVVKLFAGLCYRHRLHNRIAVIRRIINEANLIQEFQPPPQRWLGKASRFKLRWRSREKFAGVPLLRLKF